MGLQGYGAVRLWGCWVMELLGCGVAGLWSY